MFNCSEIYDLFCYVCGKHIIPEDRVNLFNSKISTTSIFKIYFESKVFLDELLMSKHCCPNCYNGLMLWFKVQRNSMQFGVPMRWQDPAKFYNGFPPLYDFDDYDACLNNKASKFESTYCMVYAEIRPQNSSILWREISQHIHEYKFHYRRDRLFFGVCMERCKHFPKILDNFHNNDSKVINEITQLFDVVHKRPLDLHMRYEYHELVNNCLNSEFQDKFNLKLKTYIEYCESPEESLEQDGPEKIFYKFLEIIIILNILSTLYDSCLKRKQPVELQNAAYYKKTPQQPVSRLLTAFSIRRNYYRLVEPYSSQLGMDLSYLDGIRSFCVIFIVIGHAYFVQYHHVKNPENFENFAKSSVHLWFTNGTLLLEVFHVLGGMLLIIKFKETFTINPQSSGTDCVKTFYKGMLLRYIRFLPSLGLFLFVNATFFTRLQDGPFWRHLTEPGRTFAREKWWKNLFIFDNISESGYPHTWYLTTDCQLFAFYFCILIAIHKYPQYKRKIFTTLAILAVLIPLSICYMYRLEPCFLITPESFRFTIVNNEDSFYQIYTPFYTNLGGYLCGIICGDIYQKYAHNEQFCKQISRIPREIYEFAFWAIIAIAVWMCWLGTVFIFKEPSIWTAIYAGLNRNLWLLIAGGGLILLGMFVKSLSAMGFLCRSAFRILARLSFQIYIWHFSILYLLNGHKREPVFTNHLRHSTLTICLFLYTIILSFIVTIFVEYPFHRVTYYYYKKRLNFTDGEIDTGPSPQDHIKPDRRSAIKHQFFSYLNDSSSADGNWQKYDLLKEAFIYFNTPLTSSAPVERLFSFAGIVNSPRRQSLSDFFL